jgi:hypothetical protein
MRIYIFGNDGITLSREPPAAVSDGEIDRCGSLPRLDIKESCSRHLGTREIRDPAETESTPSRSHWFVR